MTGCLVIGKMFMNLTFSSETRTGREFFRELALLYAVGMARLISKSAILIFRELSIVQKYHKYMA
jgi:hypothetical protein